MRHHSKSHNSLRSVSTAAVRVIENHRQEYQKQVENLAADNWLRNLATSGLVYREISGSTSKTEKFLSRLAKVMARDRDDGKTTAEIVEELARVTGIELEVQE